MPRPPARALALAAGLILLLAAWPALGAPGEPPHPVDLADLLARRDWPVAMAFVVWGIIRLLREDTRLPEELNVPGDLAPVLALALGAASGALEHVVQGVPWRDAMAGALVTGLGSMAFQNLGARLLVGVLRRVLRRPVTLLPAVLAKRDPAPPTSATSTTEADLDVEVDPTTPATTDQPADAGDPKETRP